VVRVDRGVELQEVQCLSAAGAGEGVGFDSGAAAFWPGFCAHADSELSSSMSAQVLALRNNLVRLTFPFITPPIHE
ncbi:MAG TPA: hypothetical protein VJ715_01420, partial [Pyrinomonadaceae bacterium]|nr:hypothetical protein [Pyrinomonadaceae bacterium]